MIMGVLQELPTGTVTFLFTDVEGSTKLLHDLGAEAYAQALAAHRQVIREACSGHDGVEVDTQGDAFFVAFATAPAALAAAAEFTEALASGPIRVRVGLHTGTPLLSGEGYVGVDVHRAARIAASGHGGQVLVSRATASLVDGDLRDLGEHRFKDLLAPERVYQIGTLDFPPLRSLGRSNLPVAAWPILGRERELAEIRRIVAGGARLLTLTGSGGSGKTRLALQAAAELSDEFGDGTFFVALAPLRPTVRAAAVCGRVRGSGRVSGAGAAAGRGPCRGLPLPWSESRRAARQRSPSAGGVRKLGWRRETLKPADFEAGSDLRTPQAPVASQRVRDTRTRCGQGAFSGTIRPAVRRARVRRPCKRLELLDRRRVVRPDRVGHAPGAIPEPRLVQHLQNRPPQRMTCRLPVQGPSGFGCDDPRRVLELIVLERNADERNAVDESRHDRAQAGVSDHELRAGEHRAVRHETADECVCRYAQILGRKGRAEREQDAYAKLAK